MSSFLQHVCDTARFIPEYGEAPVGEIVLTASRWTVYDERNKCMLEISEDDHRELTEQFPLFAATYAKQSFPAMRYHTRSTDLRVPVGTTLQFLKGKCVLTGKNSPEHTLLNVYLVCRILGGFKALPLRPFGFRVTNMVVKTPSARLLDFKNISRYVEFLNKHVELSGALPFDDGLLPGFHAQYPMTSKLKQFPALRIGRIVKCDRTGDEHTQLFNINHHSICVRGVISIDEAQCARLFILQLAYRGTEYLPVVVRHRQQNNNFFQCQTS